MEIDKIKGYINISHKAGYLIIGGDKLKDYNKKLYLLIYDKNALKNTMKIVEKFKERDVKIVEIENLEELTSIKNCKIVGIKNKNLSELILSLL